MLASHAEWVLKRSSRRYHQAFYKKRNKQTTLAIIESNAFTEYWHCEELSINVKLREDNYILYSRTHYWWHNQSTSMMVIALGRYSHVELVAFCNDFNSK